MKTLTLFIFLLTGLATTIHGQKFNKSDLFGKWYLVNEKVTNTSDTLIFIKNQTRSSFTVWNFSLNDTVSVSTGRIIGFEKNSLNNDKLVVVEELEAYRLRLSIDDKTAIFEMNDEKSSEKYVILFLDENNLSLTKKID